MKRRRSNTIRLVVPAIIVFFFSTVGNFQHLSVYTNDYQINDLPQNLRNNPTTIPKAVTTLVHYDPYLMGGFRNQHMRFVGFMSFAVKNNISQVLLPSLRWLDAYNKPYSIHHELLFDVNYWNTRASELGLPLLVDYDPNILEGVIISSANNETKKEVIPCWNATSSLFSGVDESLIRNPSTNIRKVNGWELIGQKGQYFSHCRRTLAPSWDNKPESIQQEAEASRENNNSTNTTTNKVYRYTHLVPHGGLQGNGRLWNDYIGLQRSRRGTTQTIRVDNNQIRQVYPDHVHVEKAIYELLRPSKYLSLAIDSVMQNAIQRNDTTATIDKPKARLLALHPRVEQEMMTHACAKYIETNLTKVFEMIRTYPPLIETNSSSINSEYRFDLMFLAVSKEQVDKIPQGKLANNPIPIENNKTLWNARIHGIFGNEITRGIPMFESGTDGAMRIQFPRLHNGKQNTSAFDTPESLGVLELVGSVINFFLLVQADIFVGVKGSSYSTDALSVRYYQGGRVNYIVGPDGTKRLYGPQEPHTKC